MQKLHPSEQLPLDKLDVESIKQSIVDLTKLNGALYLYRNQDKEYATHVPVALLPYTMKKSHYQKLQKAQYVWGKLLTAISQDKPMIEHIFCETARHDDFVRRLLSVYLKTYGDTPQKINFHIVRSDYMRDRHTDRYLLVEYNLIAVSMGCLSEKVQHVFRNFIPTILPDQYRQQKFPEVNNIKLISEGMQHALKTAKLTGLVVFVVAENERNIFDQRFIEAELTINHGRQVIRATIQQLSANNSLDEATRIISFKGKPVSMFYFRDGYEPSHYTTEECWKLRENIERSTAISIPTVVMQLVNFKRAQQQLTLQIMAKYIIKQQSELLDSCMAKMWNFQDDKKQQELIKMTELGNSVLKPNRQGGGHNTYGKEVTAKLLGMSVQARKEFVLMERIYPQPLGNYLVKNEQIVREPSSISELSIYSTILWDGKDLIQNKLGGALVRTKSIASDEGGIATGFSVVSSLYFENE